MNLFPRKSRSLKAIVGAFTKAKNELEALIKEESGIIEKAQAHLDSEKELSNKKLAAVTNEFNKKEKALRTKKHNKTSKINGDLDKTRQTVDNTIAFSTQSIEEAKKWLKAIPTV